MSTNELTIRIDRIDLDSLVADNQTATYRVDATLCGVSIPWNIGYGRYDNHPIEICEVGGLELRITVSDNCNDSEISWHSETAKYPINSMHIDAGEVQDEIDALAEQYENECRKAYQG